MKRNIYILLIITLLTTACDSLLDISPRQSIDASKALTTREGFNAALANAYAILKEQELYGRDLVVLSECFADNTRIINRAGGRFINEGSNLPTAHFATNTWAGNYIGINECNLMLEALPDLQADAAFKDAIEGQVKFLRALYYFELSRVFAYEPKVEIKAVSQGGVPLITKGVLLPSEITFPSRATIDDVYKLIYEDLTVAVAKAPTSAGAPHYATKAAANALFARVALYNQDYANAIKYASAALTGGVGTFVTKDRYIQAWRDRVHPESIFELLFQTTDETLGVNNSIQSAYTTRISLTSTSLGGWGAVVPTTAFLNLMPAATDVRRGLYENGVNRSGSVVIECTKFMNKSGAAVGTTYMDNVPILRVSEMYLIRAEASAKSADEIQARKDVNTIRSRAGLTEITDAITGTALINEIMLQRSLELAFEGHRWFDLKRTATNVVKTTGNVPFDDYRMLAPIPLRDIQANSNLKQNNGY